MFNEIQGQIIPDTMQSDICGSVNFMTVDNLQQMGIKDITTKKSFGM
jgi:hypothetical protein